MRPIRWSPRTIALIIDVAKADRKRPGGVQRRNYTISARDGTITPTPTTASLIREYMPNTMKIFVTGCRLVMILIAVTPWVVGRRLSSTISQEAKL
jgi:hypothetical protein